MDWRKKIRICKRLSFILFNLGYDATLRRFWYSGEINFKVADADEAIESVLSAYREDANSIDETDGVSLAFDDWRFNLRRSNTEPLVRLNVESKSKADTLEAHVREIADLLGGTRA